MSGSEQVYLVEVFYDDYDGDQQENIVGSFTDKTQAEAVAKQYRKAFTPEPVQRPMGWLGLDNVRVQVYSVPLNTVVALPVRMYIAQSPQTVEHLHMWNGIALVMFNPATGEDYFNSISQNFAPCEEDIAAAIASPDEVVDYKALLYSISAKYETVSTEVDMLMSMNRHALEAALSTEV